VKLDKITVLLGLLVTLICSGVTFFYLDYRSQNQFQRESNSFFDSLESVDLRYNDLKYKFRGQRESKAPVALIAIDDDSVREIGRWPWSRDLMAQMTEKLISHGAKSVAFDIIFSEPEKGFPQNDDQMAAVISKNKDKIILGTFSDDGSRHLPYQDYCVTEAFLKTGGDQIVKLNSTFVVEDSTTNAYEELPWDTLFAPLFAQVQSVEEQKVLMSLGRARVEDLSSFQKKYLEFRQNRALFEYCHHWLRKEDVYVSNEWLPQTEALYKKFFSANKTLKPLSIEEFSTQLKENTPGHPIPEYGEWTGNIPKFQVLADFTASFIAMLDSDGYVRRYPLFYRSGNKLGSSFIPSLALQSYLMATGHRADVKIDMVPGQQSKAITQFTITDPSQDPEKKVYDLPTDSAGQVLVNFYGPQMSLPYIPAKDFFSDSPKMRVRRSVPDQKTKQLYIDEELVDKKEFLNGRSVIVGATAVALYDLRNTPTEANYPGPEIHLTTLANLLEGNFIEFWKKENPQLPFLMLFLGVILTFCFSYFGSLASFIISLSVLLVALVVDFWLFVQNQIKTSGVFVLFLVAFSYFLITIYRFFTEEKTKKELRSTFSRYVSPAIVDELLKEPENLKLGGRRQRMSVFFSDLRGFTTISEKLPPEGLVSLLNRYLSPMTEIIFQNKGTLDKYMGDAIMAFFGAPIASPNHAEQACRCALASLVKLKELQKIFAAEGLPFIDIGIGINTGEMSVGNMGSNIVQNYTVMGDSVNLASRLEGTNKEYGSKIIISEFTYNDVKNTFIAREIDRVRVKGKSEPVRIYELIQEGKPGVDLQKKLTGFTRGYEAYMSKKFSDALVIFKQTLAELGPDPVSDVFIERCEEFLTEPPPLDWDGVYVMKTK